MISWNNVPKRNNTEGIKLIGQKNYTSGSENVNSIQAANESLYWPFSICAHQQKLYIADTGNHRITIRNELDY